MEYNHLIKDNIKVPRCIVQGFVKLTLPG